MANLHNQSRIRQLKFIIGICVVFAVFVASCSNPNGVTGQGGPTSSGTQTETSATTSYVGGTNRLVVGYNDETSEQDLITYTQNDRTIKAGASLMGSSFSDDGGTTWTYGGKVPPPNGWAVLWGDPALATSGSNYSVVFMANLAMPSSKFPTGGIHGYVYYGDGRSSYVGGGCVARSTDGGKTFSNYQCVSNKQPIEGVADSSQGHFYDGGSLASNRAGEIFLAYVDVTTSTADVYRSPSYNGTFAPIATPFPGLTVASHVRLRVGTDNSLYAAAQVIGNDGGTYVYLNRYINGAWRQPVPGSYDSVLYPGIDFGTTTQGSELNIRTGPQFGYDIGSASEGGKDAVRMLYTRSANGHLYLSGTACSADLTSCSDVPGWKFIGGGPGGSAVDTYNPDVTAWAGFIGVPATWQSSWAYHYGNANFVNVSRATLGYLNGGGFLFPVDIIKNALVCSDERGYWGDYDAMVLTGFSGSSTKWIRFSSDSSAGCNERWMYVGKQQHVQQATYTY